MTIGVISISILAGSISYVLLAAKDVGFRRTTGISPVSRRLFEKRALFVAATVLVTVVYEVFTYRRFWTSIIAGILYWVVSTKFAEKNEEKRKRQMVKELPQVIEIMALLIDAGLNVTEAIRYVVRDEKGLVVDMLNQAYMEMEAGSPRTASLKRMAESSKVDEVRFFVKTLIQAEEFGKPIKHVLLDMARNLRIRRRYDVATRANRLPTLMLIPIFVFILPPVLLLYTLPALINMRQVY